MASSVTMLLILYGAAMNGVNADGVKFIDALIESGFVKEEDAIAAGSKEVPAPSELKVESVKAPSLKEISCYLQAAPIKMLLKTKITMQLKQLKVK